MYIHTSICTYACMCIVAQARSRGGSVGSEEPPSQRKGPLFCNERSHFLIKGPPFKTKGPLLAILANYTIILSII